MLAQCNIGGEISHMRYHWVNKNSSSQEKDEFDNKLHDNENQIIILITFTNLDVLVETIMIDLLLTGSMTEMVLCFVKPCPCIYIKKDRHYRFPENIAIVDRRW